MIDLKEIRPGTRSKWEEGVAAYKALDGSITWYAKIPINGRTRVVKLENCRNITQAKAARGEERSKVFRRKWQPGHHGVTVRRFAPEFIDAKKPKIKTWKKYEQQLRDFWLPAIGSLELDEVTTADVEKHLGRLRSGGASESTVRGYAACLQSLFVQARKARKTTNNPVRDAELPRPKETEKPGLLSAVAKVAAEADKRDDDMRPLFWLLFHSGMRIAHAARLRWAEIDFDLDVLQGEPDKRGSSLTLPLHPKLKAELLRHRERQQKRRKHPSQWVFASHRVHKAHRAVRHLQEDWNLWMWELGVKLTRHDMRHAFITRVDAAGGSEKQIQKMTGQKTIRVIKGYTHPEIETLRKLLGS